MGITHSAVKETRTSEPTPEQLVKLLDCQLALARQKRATENHAPRRAALLAGGVLFIVVACCAALLVLQQMLSDLQHRPAVDEAAQAASAEQNENFEKQGNAGISAATSL